jgi:hypothetical protein
MYPNELQIKDTTERSTTVLYLNILLKFNTNGKLAAQFYDKGDDFNFFSIDFPYLCSNSPTSPASSVYISQLIRYARVCSTYDKFLIRRDLQTS